MHPTTPPAAPLMPPRTNNPVLVTEAYHIQANAAAADITIGDLPDLGRYYLQVSDAIYVYVDTAGLQTLVDQATRILASTEALR